MTKPNRGGPGAVTLRDSSGDEGFLGRWSRRKAEAKEPAAVADAEPDAVESDLAATNELPSEETPSSPTDTEQVNQLPAAEDIDKLGPGSDFSVFMQAGVPPALRTKALRKLWRMKPELANLDGLLDYGEDLTGSFKVTDQLKTAYEVGKGFLRDVDDKAEKEEKELENNELENDEACAQPLAESIDERAKLDQTAENRSSEKPLQDDDTLPVTTPKG